MNKNWEGVLPPPNSGPNDTCSLPHCMNLLVPGTLGRYVVAVKM